LVSDAVLTCFVALLCIVQFIINGFVHLTTIVGLTYCFTMHNV